MKPYQTWSAQDFACDDDFILWVKYADRYPYLDLFWKKWLQENPEREEVVEEARMMVLTVISEKQYHADAVRKQELWETIRASARLPVRREVPLRRRWYSSAAAAVLLAIFVGWYSFDTSPPIDAAPVAEQDQFYIKHVNNSGAPKTIILGDGTSIILQPQSALEYPQVFEPDLREVRLTGEAFFDVGRDPNRPFLVHAGEIMTRVLGTSFTVRNFDGESNVLVQVKTGKVSVFMADAKARRSELSEKTVDGVILMPNQQVLYERLEMKMTKSLVENPIVLIPVPRHEFEFVDAPIKQVFAAIEEAYGVEIVFDEEALSSCYLNASLSDVPLYEKLKLICKGINCTYEIMDSHIIVYGKGCQEEITNPNEN